MHLRQPLHHERVHLPHLPHMTDVHVCCARTRACRLPRSLTSVALPSLSAARQAHGTSAVRRANEMQPGRGHAVRVAIGVYKVQQARIVPGVNRALQRLHLNKLGKVLPQSVAGAGMRHRP